MASKRLRKQKKQLLKKAAQTTAAVAVEEGIPNLVEAPVGIRQALRYSQLSIGEAGGGRQMADVWATFLDDLKSLDVSDDALARIKDLGAEKVLGGKSQTGFAKSITSLPGWDEKKLRDTKDSLVQARHAVRGTSKKTIAAEMDDLLAAMSKDAKFQTDDGKRIIAALKKPANRELLAKIGSNQTMSVLAQRGADPWWMQQYHKVLKKKNTAVLPESMQDFLRETGKAGKMPAVTAGTKTALKGAGAAGKELAGGMGRKALGVLGKSAGGALGMGALAYFEGKRFIDLFGREGRAKRMARAGFEGLGPSSSVDFLRQEVATQEMVARRKTVMQQYNPDTMDDIIRILSQSGQSSPTLTSTERRIGKGTQMGAAPRGRKQDDVKFMLDELFNQMGGMTRGPQ